MARSKSELDFHAVAARIKRLNIDGDTVRASELYRDVDLLTGFCERKDAELVGLKLSLEHVKEELGRLQRGDKPDKDSRI